MSQTFENILDKEENCECGLKEDGTWSEEVFDRYGCSCEESDDEDNNS